MCSDFFNVKWEHQPFHEPQQYPFAEPLPQKPLMLEKMLECAEVLSSNKPFSRIDFYEIQNRVFFGEITFFPTSGFGGFSPKTYDLIFGDLIKLPERQSTYHTK